jgi:hypothetical protein
LVNSVFPREAGNKLGFMLGDPPRKIVGNADIQRAISLAPKNIDKKQCIHLRFVPRRRYSAPLKRRGEPLIRT